MLGGGGGGGGGGGDHKSMYRTVQCHLHSKVFTILSGGYIQKSYL